MVLNSNVARTKVTSVYISYTIVSRVIIATTDDVIPLVVETLIHALSTVSIAKVPPSIVVTHAASSKLKVTAGELSTLVILLSRNAHVTFSANLEVFKVGSNQWHINSQLNSWYTTKDGSLRDGSKVRSTTRVLRCSTMVTYGIAEAANAQHAISEFDG